VLAHLMFALVRFRARKGLGENPPDPSAAAENPGHTAPIAKKAALRTGIRGETYAYWYLRRHGYTLIAKNYTLPGFKGEIDLVGYDGQTLAFVEVKTRVLPKLIEGTKYRSPEEAVDWEKRRNVTRMARQFLRMRRIDAASHRFDIVAIESQAGTQPQIRLHKGAFRSGT
jgi:putative endonuclease